MRKYSLVLLKEEIIMLETAMEMEKKMDKMVRLLTVQILTEDIIDMDSDNDIAVLKATFELIDISKKNDG